MSSRYSAYSTRPGYRYTAGRGEADSQTRVIGRYDKVTIVHSTCIVPYILTVINQSINQAIRRLGNIPLDNFFLFLLQFDVKLQNQRQRQRQRHLQTWHITRHKGIRDIGNWWYRRGYGCVYVEYSLDLCVFPAPDLHTVQQDAYLGMYICKKILMYVISTGRFSCTDTQTVQQAGRQLCTRHAMPCHALCTPDFAESPLALYSTLN